MRPLDSFTIGRVVIRQRFGFWYGVANIQGQRSWTLSRSHLHAETWMYGLVERSGLRTWCLTSSHGHRSVSLCRSLRQP